MNNKTTNNLIKRALLTAFIAGSIIFGASCKSEASEIDPNNQAEIQDEIVCTFFYGWWGNIYYRQSPEGPGGGWEHWQESNHQPPKTWAANYVPNYPDSVWNPDVQLYDSWDTEVLKWISQNRNLIT